MRPAAVIGAHDAWLAPATVDRLHVRVTVEMAIQAPLPRKRRTGRPERGLGPPDAG